MIKEVSGDLLNSKATFLCHQVNCKGVMGAGVAVAIRRHMLSREQYQVYRDTCKNHSAKELLGEVQYFKSVDGKHVICNLFAEDIPTGTALDTDYKALYHCFSKVKEKMYKNNIRTLAIPGYIGCGLAGGDWEIVFNKILIPLFAESYIELEILYFPDTIEKMWESFRRVSIGRECIKEKWHGFEKGTSVKKVKEYLENTIGKNIMEI